MKGYSCVAGYDMLRRWWNRSGVYSGGCVCGCERGRSERRRTKGHRIWGLRLKEGLMRESEVDAYREDEEASIEVQRAVGAKKCL